MYPRIPREPVADPKGSADPTLRNTALDDFLWFAISSCTSHASSWWTFARINICCRIIISWKLCVCGCQDTFPVRNNSFKGTLKIKCWTYSFKSDAHWKSSHSIYRSSGASYMLMENGDEERLKLKTFFFRSWNLVSNSSFLPYPYHYDVALRVGKCTKLLPFKCDSQTRNFISETLTWTNV
jgi:hypothetical protein